MFILSTDFVRIAEEMKDLSFASLIILWICWSSIFVNARRIMNDVTESTNEITTDINPETTELSTDNGMLLGELKQSQTTVIPTTEKAQPTTVKFYDNHKNFSASQYLGAILESPPVQHINKYQEQYKEYYKQKDVYNTKKPLKFEANSQYNQYAPSTGLGLGSYESVPKHPHTGPEEETEEDGQYNVKEEQDEMKIRHPYEFIRQQMEQDHQEDEDEEDHREGHTLGHGHGHYGHEIGHDHGKGHDYGKGHVLGHEHGLHGQGHGLGHEHGQHGQGHGLGHEHGLHGQGHGLGHEHGQHGQGHGLGHEHGLHGQGHGLGHEGLAHGLVESLNHNLHEPKDLFNLDLDHKTPHHSTHSPSHHGHKNIKKPNPWKKVLHVLTTLIPFGLILATLTPNLLLINSTVPSLPSRQRSLDDFSIELTEEDKEDPLVQLIEKFGGLESMEDPKCEDRIFCEMSTLGQQSSSNFVQRSFWFLAKETPDSVAEQLGVRELFKAIRTNSCDYFNCVPKKTENEKLKKKKNIT